MWRTTGVTRENVARSAWASWFETGAIRPGMAGLRSGEKCNVLTLSSGLNSAHLQAERLGADLCTRKDRSRASLDGQTPQHKAVAEPGWLTREKTGQGARTESQLRCLRILAGEGRHNPSGTRKGFIGLFTQMSGGQWGTQCRDWPQREASVSMLLESAEKLRAGRGVHPLPIAAHTGGEPTPVLPLPTLPAPVSASHGPKPVTAQGLMGPRDTVHSDQPPRA